MHLTANQRSLIERVINAIETGKPDGDYGAISIYPDGPHDIRQLTYGRAQTTEYGNLRKLVTMYVAAGGAFSDALAPFAHQVGSQPLTDNRAFRELLRQAGKTDPVMRTVQDRFFEEAYFLPAMRWADDHGFIEPLSMLVIYDSFIHSGGILWLLRQQFSAFPPVLGGSERRWIEDYMMVRLAWLSTHRRPAVRKSAYRAEALLTEIAAGNWDLSRLPIIVNGIRVEAQGAGLARAVMTG
jgi:hypothetical protein